MDMWGYRMTKRPKLIWFFEDNWTKCHAAIGINAERTVCGIFRSSRAILPSEICKSNMPMQKCLKCLAALRPGYGYEDGVAVDAANS